MEKEYIDLEALSALEPLKQKIAENSINDSTVSATIDLCDNFTLTKNNINISLPLDDSLLHNHQENVPINSTLIIETKRTATDFDFDSPGDTIKKSKSDAEIKDNFSPEEKADEVNLLAPEPAECIFENEQQYLVKWKGYTDLDNTWEPKRNLSCHHTIKALEESLKALPRRAGIPGDPILRPFGKQEEDLNYYTYYFLPKYISDFLRLVSSDEGPMISIVNEVNKFGPPTGFQYITNSIKSKDIPTIPEDAICGCECIESCVASDDNCNCNALLEGTVPYNRRGLLNLPFVNFIYECNSKCKCSNVCINRVIQRGRTVNLQIFMTKFKGWGVRAMAKIPKGKFITQYIGEIISFEEAEKRGVAYDAVGRTYLFDLDFGTPSESNCQYTIDALKFGNVSHFFNHSCDPNIQVYPALIEHQDISLHNLPFFAIRDIEMGEELTFDYLGETHILGTDFDNSPLSKEGGNSGGYKCYCGTTKCRKVFEAIYLSVGLEFRLLAA